MLFDIQHVTLGQKVAKTMVLTIFLVIAWSGLDMVLVVLKILDVLAKTDPMIQETL